MITYYKSKYYIIDFHFYINNTTLATAKEVFSLRIFKKYTQLVKLCYSCLNLILKAVISNGCHFTVCYWYFRFSWFKYFLHHWVTMYYSLLAPPTCFYRLCSSSQITSSQLHITVKTAAPTNSIWCVFYNASSIVWGRASDLSLLKLFSVNKMLTTFRNWWNVLKCLHTQL